MLDLPLEPTDDRASPDFKTAAECEQWLGQLQLTNLQRAHSILLSQLNELNRFAMKGGDRLKVLERVRETVGYVQDDYAKKLVGKPLPFNDNEIMVFVGITQLWQAMVTGYQRCLQALLDGEAVLNKYVALLCQRCLSYTGRQIFEHLRSGYEFDPQLWHQLHQLYAYAETQELHLSSVSDPLNKVQPKVNCQAVYLKTLLSCYARPAELNRSQIQSMDRWLTLWTVDMSIEKRCAVSKGDASPLAIDLSSQQGLQAMHLVKQSDQIRYVPMVPLSKLLRVKTVLLQQGKSPQQVELGGFINAVEGIAFLKFLHQCWCEDRNIRASERRSVEQEAEVCSQPESIYAHFSGRAFAQPGAEFAALTTDPLGAGSEDDESDEDEEDLLAFQFPLEKWHIENESLLGARLLRDDMFGGRLSFRQLIAVRPSDAKRFILGVTAWVNVRSDGKLCIGVRYLPGVAQAVSVRLNDDSDEHQKAQPGFKLPEVEVLKSSQSLIIPRNWFEQDKMLELYQGDDDEPDMVRMIDRLERGADYDRITFVKIEETLDMDF